MRVGFIGLGKMGSRMVLKLLGAGHEVVVWNRSIETIENFKLQITNAQLDRIQFAQTIEELVQILESPRIIWSMLPAGEATENALAEVGKFTQANDIVIDGGNAHFSDTQRRFEQFQKKGIKFLGIGVSGGVHAFENGFTLMAGGDKAAFERISPLLETFAQPRADFAYLGTGGAGHFAKMVHNAIEYGMMQAIGEGFGILEKAPYAFNLLQAAKIYQKGSIISSFLIDRTVDALSKDERLSRTTGIVDATGEAKWAIEQAKKEGVDVEITEKSLEFRKKSQTVKKVQESFAAKLVAALRHEFGGHGVKKK